MAYPNAPQTRTGFKIAIICAVLVEAESVRAVFDKCWEDEGRSYGKAVGDKNTYTTGVIGQYNVVLVLLPGMGGVPAAQAAASLSLSYPKIELLLVVGVCGVVPRNPETGDEIILGDVIISTAVTQYDFGRTYPGDFLRKTSTQDSLRKAPKEIQGFVNKLTMRQTRQSLDAKLTRLVNSPQFLQDEPTAIYPGAAQDHLYDSSYLHQHRPPIKCHACHDGLGAICSVHCGELGCETEKRISRKRLQHLQALDQSARPDAGPLIHIGRIGSANTVMKSGVDRDILASKEKLIAFEMEGAGVWDEHPTIVIKGACDYADSHKHKAWQPYAAMMAAACLKVVLTEWVMTDELMGDRDPLLDITQLTRSMSLNGGGSVQRDNVSDYIEQQIDRNAPNGRRCLEPVTVPPKIDTDFRGPVGIRLGQAPYIDPEFFVGRESEQNQMRDILLPDNQPQRPRRLALGGMGGVGKTQLVIAYTNRHRDNYSSAFWLDATTQATLEADFQGVACQIFGASEMKALSRDQAIARVHQWLSHTENTRWLLIFDNYDDPGQYKLQQFYPPASHGTIVITTRRPDQVGAQKILIKPLQNVQESLKILATRSGREDASSDPDAEILATRLAGLPLALATVGAYLQTSHLTFHQYYEAYEARWNVDPYDPIDLQEYQDRTLYTTWSLSYARLESERPPAAQLLRLLAYFDNQCIWYELLHARNWEALPWLQEIVTDEVQFGGIMRTLTNYCFVELQQSTRTWSIHNCVHDWTFAVLNNDIDTQHYQYAFQCVAALLEKTDWWKLSHISYAPLTAHAIRLLHERFWQDKLLNEIDHKWFPQACYNIALLLDSQDRLPEAEWTYMQAIAGYEKTLGLNDVRTLDAVNNLGVVYLGQRKLDEAERMLVRALGGREKALGSDHISTLEAANNIGTLYCTRNRLDEAEQMYIRALTGYEQALKSDHLSAVATINNLASLYRDQNKLDEAEQMYIRAITGYERALGPDHVSTLQTVNSLGSLLHDKNRLDEAEQMYIRALTGYERALQPDHTSTLKTVNNLGILYHDQYRLGKQTFAEAEKMYIRARTGREKTLGPNHSSTLLVVKNLRILYADKAKIATDEGDFVVIDV